MGDFDHVLLLPGAGVVLNDGGQAVSFHTWHGARLDLFNSLSKSLSGRRRTKLLYQTRVNEEPDRISRLHTVKEDNGALSNTCIDVRHCE